MFPADKINIFLRMSIFAMTARYRVVWTTSSLTPILKIEPHNFSKACLVPSQSINGINSTPIPYKNVYYTTAIAYCTIATESAHTYPRPIMMTIKKSGKCLKKSPIFFMLSDIHIALNVAIII